MLQPGISHLNGLLVQGIASEHLLVLVNLQNCFCLRAEQAAENAEQCFIEYHEASRNSVLIEYHEAYDCGT